MAAFNFREGSESAKTPLKPALYDPPKPSTPAQPAASKTGTPATAGARESTPATTAPRESAPGASTGAAAAPSLTDTPQSKLSVGVNIKLKGVEISDCDSLIIEGHVEAVVNSKAMQIAQPGTLKGTAVIDVAEIHGDFSGELTARMRLVVHGTGKVSGTIRYGKLIVEEGGELSGDVKRLDAADAPAQQSSRNGTAERHGYGAPGDRGFAHERN